MGGSKHWCFTHNNYTDCDIEEYVFIGESLAAPGGGRYVGKYPIRYFVFGKEVGSNGTPHVQGFVSFVKRTSLQGARKAFPGTHLESARGTPDQAATYCKKDGVFNEYGTLPAQSGSRSDLDALGRAILAGATKDDLQESYPGQFVRYRHNIEQMLRERVVSRDWETDVRVFWGKTGTGKTRRVYEFVKRDEIYVHPGGPWFDGYHGQSVVLFDDYTGSCFKIGYLLKLLDRYPMKVPVKGGFVEFCPKHIFFTSNMDPRTWYSNALPEHINAMFRRINSIQHFE